ncbi:hypothetical protein EMPG_12286 [Blastomyces silverae]|uniref:Uncharacterized protein n=1 Tax=Blastomyces silverae TaxID=2060906 RepID=A0A0H1BNV2_9EURO|nr:hypothetical protein EMPG_12286 [Blastomyces silverae]
MDALYLKKTHRRSQSCKKQSTETTESVVPGRAPVCFVTTETGSMDSDICAKDDIDENEDGEDHALVVAATTASPTTENSDICLSGNGIKQAGLMTTPAEGIRVKSCYQKQSTKQPAAHTNNPSSITTPPETLSSPCETSPVTNREIPAICPSSSTFTTSEPSIVIPSRSSSAEITTAEKAIPQPTRPARGSSENTSRDSSFCQYHFRAARSRKSSAELDDINNLPSSRPISLSSFAVRTHSRNKGSKSWVPFSLEDLNEDSDEMDRRNQNHGARLPAPVLTPSATTVSHPLRNVTTIDPRSNMFGFHGISPQRAPQWPQGIRQQSHPGQKEIFGYPQQNFGTAIPHYNPRPTIVPPTTNATPGTGPRIMVPDDISPTKQEEKQALRALQYSMVAQIYLQTGNYPQGPIGNPNSQAQNMCPTNSRRCAGYHGQTTGYIDQDHSLKPPPMIREQGNTHYSGFSPGQIQPWIHNMLSETGTSCATAESCQDTDNVKNASVSLSSQLSLSLKRRASHQTNVNTSPQRINSDQPSNAKLHDTVKYLNNVITTSQTATESNRDQEFQIECKDYVGENHATPLTANPLKSSHKALQQDPSLVRNVATPQAQRTPNNGHIQGALPDPGRISTSMPLTYTSSNGPTSVSPAFASAITNGPENDEVLSKSTNSSRSRFKFRFPPPGLPIPPSLQGGLADKHAGEEAPITRLVQSNAWFHTDTRGEDILRQRIVELARDEVERQRTTKMPLRPGEREGVAEAGTVLLGQALANLQSYTLSGSNQAKGFANFGPAPKFCYEPIHSSRKSFFDLDPITDPWKLPPPRHPLSKNPLVAYEERNRIVEGE